MNSIKYLIISFFVTVVGYTVWAQGEPIKIMPLGNSITKGSGTCMEPDSYFNCIGYRRHLYHLLDTNGFNVDMVGSQGGAYQNLPEPKDYDNDHEGHGGKTAWWMNTRLNGPDEYFLPNADPDVILYHIGTNNLNVGNIELYAAAAEESLNIIWDYDSTITVVLAKIILSIDDSLRNVRTHNYNILLEEMAQTKADSGYSIYVADMETALDYETDMWDQLHPNQQGYDKMAEVWYDILANALVPPEPTAPIIATEPDTSLSVGMVFDYNVDAYGYPKPVYHLLESPAGMTIDTVTGQIEWLATMQGNYDVSVEASNSEGSDVQDFTLNVNQSPPCTDGMISYWKLEETAAPYEDSFGLNDGDCTSCPDPVTGQVGGAQDFDDTEPANTIEIPNSDSYSSELTLMAWINPDNLDVVDRGIISRNNSFVLEVESDGDELSFTIISGTSFDEFESDAPENEIPVGIWTHVAATFNSGISTIYINGELIDSKLINFTTIGASFDPYTIGWTSHTQWPGSRYFDGKIDEVAIYDRALSEIEIFDLYMAGLNGHSYCDNHITFSARVLLEGPYNNGEISKNLNQTGYLPTNQPYDATPWIYSGSESVGGLNENTSDWVLVELRSDPTTTLARRSAFIDKDGNIVDLDGISQVKFEGIAPGDYYLVVHHRNHLSVMSANTIYFDNSGSTSYDFTTGIEQYYQNSGAIQLPDGSWAMITGNTDGSSQVNQADLDNWTPEAGLKGYYPGDFNFDTEVDNKDKNDFLIPSMDSPIFFQYCLESF